MHWLRSATINGTMCALRAITATIDLFLFLTFGLPSQLVTDCASNVANRPNPIADFTRKIMRHMVSCWYRFKWGEIETTWNLSLDAFNKCCVSSSVFFSCSSPFGAVWPYGIFGIFALLFSMRSIFQPKPKRRKKKFIWSEPPRQWESNEI